MDEVTHNQPELSELLRVRREKLEALRAAGQDPFVITQFKRSHSCNDILTGFETLEGKRVTLAGRIMSKRIMGKASFSHIMDQSGLNPSATRWRRPTTFRNWTLVYQWCRGRGV